MGKLAYDHRRKNNYLTIWHDRVSAIIPGRGFTEHDSPRCVQAAAGHVCRRPAPRESHLHSRDAAPSPLGVLRSFGDDGCELR